MKARSSSRASPSRPRRRCVEPASSPTSLLQGGARARERLALRHGTRRDARRPSRSLIATANATAALGIAVTGSGARALLPRLGELEGNAAATQVQRELTALLADEDVWSERAQPPVSARVLPQVHGAALSALAALDDTLESRLRGTTDSPLYLQPSDGAPGGSTRRAPFTPPTSCSAWRRSRSPAATWSTCWRSASTASSTPASPGSRTSSRRDREPKPAWSPCTRRSPA